MYCEIVYFIENNCEKRSADLKQRGYNRFWNDLLGSCIDVLKPDRSVFYSYILSTVLLCLHCCTAMSPMLYSYVPSTVQLCTVQLCPQCCTVMSPQCCTVMSPQCCTVMSPQCCTVMSPQCCTVMSPVLYSYVSTVPQWQKTAKCMRKWPTFA